MQTNNVAAKENEIGNQTVIIPLSLPNSYEVAGFIAALIDVNNNVLSICEYDKFNYFLLGYNKLATEIDAEDVILQCLVLQKDVFNITKFKILDNKLFNTQQEGSTEQRKNFEISLLNTLEINTTSSREGGAIVKQNHCIGHDEIGPGGHEEGDCDECIWCGEYSYDIVYFEPPFYWGGGGFGGGGNWGGGWNGGGGVNFIASLQSTLSLDQTQTNWLINHPESQHIVGLINAELGADSYSDEAKTVAKILIDLGVNNLLETTWYIDFAYTAKPHLENLYSCCPSILMLQPSRWSQQTIANYAITRHDHPEWSKWKCAWVAIKETVHTTLDLAGMIPIIGEVCDLTNGTLYTIEEDGFNATLSFAATIPIAGWATIAKFAKKTIIVADGSKRTLKWIKLTNNIIDFGDRDLLRKVLGLANGDSRIAHHIIPWEKSSHDLIQMAASGRENAFHLNSLLNGIPLTAVQHTGSHANYTTLVTQKMDAIRQTLINSGAYNTQNAITALTDLINNTIKPAILNSPNTPINQLLF